MILLADNDILIKLAQCDLFGEFFGAFGVDFTDIRVLSTVRHSTRSKKLQKRIGEAAAGRLEAFLAEVSDIDTEPDPEAIRVLTERTDNNIDAGEAVLFAVCPQIPDSLILTGDKRSLAGLKTATTSDTVCERLCASLCGRVVCFEQVVLRIVDHSGFERVYPNLFSSRNCDSGLAMWLGSSLIANEASFREGLASFLNDARSKSGGLLAP